MNERNTPTLPAEPTIVASATAQTDAGLSTGQAAWRPPETIVRIVPVVLAIVGLMIFGTVSSAHFLTLINFQNLFQEIAVVGILTIGMTILMVAGQLDLTMGSAVSLLSVIGAKLLVQAGWGEGEVVVGLIVIAVSLNVFVGAVIAVSRVEPFVITLGGLSVLAGVALILSNQQPIPIGLHFTALSLAAWGPFPVPAVILVSLFVLAALFLRFTRLGRAAYTIGSNEDAAYIAGVPLVRVKIMLFATNGMLVGIAGVMLLARLGNGDPNGGLGLELEALTAAVLGGAAFTGGRGRMLGSFLGVFLLGLISNALTIANVPSLYGQIAYGVVLMVAVVTTAIGDLRRKTNVPIRRQMTAALGRRRKSHS